MGPVQLQAKMLSTTLNGLNTPEEWQHFGRHALPVCSAAFVVLADQQMRGWSDDTIEDAGSDRYQHFRPYFVMLCELQKEM